MPYALYIASVVGALALLMMLPRRGFTPGKLGALLGAATLGGLWLWLGRSLPGYVGLGKASFIYYYVFSFIAIASAVRVITHTKPVFSALWFVMVVLATSGLFIVLSAEFVAFAMIIIYGGAILVTYVFVIMLASHSGDSDPGLESETPEYDRVAREPIAAVATGFALLAAVLTVSFMPIQRNPRAAALSDEQVLRGDQTHRPLLVNRPSERIAMRLASEGNIALPGAVLVPTTMPAEFPPGVTPPPGVSVEPTTTREASDAAPATRPAMVAAPVIPGKPMPVDPRTGQFVPLPHVESTPIAASPAIADAQRVDNIERVGIDLFQGHPLGLELAGVILLLSLVGAVVIARKRVE